MRVVLDTNILVSGLIAPAGTSAAILKAWRKGLFTILPCEVQVNELRSTLRKPRVAELIKPHQAGRLVNWVRKVAEVVEGLPEVRRSVDPDDDYLLALWEAGRADYLVTGDKGHLLTLAAHSGARIVSGREFIALWG